MCVIELIVTATREASPNVGPAGRIAWGDHAGDGIYM